jgi:hypothetical protein
MNILKSATKIVFLIVSLTACAWFFIGKITNEQFIGIVMLVMGFYYANNKPTTPSV